MRSLVLLSLVLVLGVGKMLMAQETRETPLAGQHQRAWTVDNETRVAIVIPPQKELELVPVVLVFHGHGGNMNNTAKQGFQKQWPEALVICPQGLPTATQRDPQGRRSGWQPWHGANDDRDLKFVDVILQSIREDYKIDDSRIYVTGHSNGGGFAYLLWSTRAEQFAAVAPSAAGGANLRFSQDVKPIPILHLAGESDRIVPFETQTRTMELVREILQCESTSKEWAKLGSIVAKVHESKINTPFVSAIHPGNHRYPDDAPELIVKFFKQHSKVNEAQTK